MSGMCGGAEEVLVRVCRFAVKVGGDAFVGDAFGIVTSRKLMDVEEVSLVNLMVGCMWLSVLMKSVSSSCPCVHR